MSRWVERLHLTVVHDHCALAASNPRRSVLAAIYPRLRQIVLFEACIDRHAAGWSSKERERLCRQLVMHEVYHYLRWQRCRRRRRHWSPRCPEEEAAARRFADRCCSRTTTDHCFPVNHE